MSQKHYLLGIVKVVDQAQDGRVAELRQHVVAALYQFE